MTEESRYDVRAIRDLLVEGFSVEELQGLFAFARDLDLRPVADEFTPADGIAARADKAVLCCERRSLLDKLLVEVNEARPLLYDRYRARLQRKAIRSEFCHNLGHPDYEVFVGREEELARIHELLLPRSAASVIAIDGIRGIGKSALALEVARHYCYAGDNLPQEERFEAIIWTSAEETHLSAGGIDDPEAGQRALKDILRTIADTLDRGDITLAEAEERPNKVIKTLGRQRTLLIVDNLEMVDDKHIAGFIARMPETTKVIVTARPRMRRTRRVHLMAMPEKDARKLIAQECEKGGVTLSEDQIGQLYERTGGMPLAVEWSVGRLADGDTMPNVLRGLTRSDTDLAKTCFEGSVKSLRGKDAGKDAYHLLLASALFAEDASREALCEVSGVQDEWRCGEGLLNLQRRSLLNRDEDSDRFSLLPLTRSYLQHELRRSPLFSQEAFERMLMYYRELVIPPAMTGVPYWDGLINETGARSLAPEQGSLLQTIGRALDEHHYQAALDLFLPIVHFLGGWGLWDEREKLSEKMCQVARELGNTAEVWLWVDSIAWIRLERRQVPECRSALEKGRSLAQELEIPLAIVLADAWESALYSREGNPDAAREKIDSALAGIDVDRALESEDIVHCAIAARVVRPAAELSEIEGDFGQARKYYFQEWQLREMAGENAAAPLVSLGNVSLRLDDDVKPAETYFRRALADAKRNETAWSKYGLALVAERKGEFLEAREWCERALEQFRKLGLTDAEQKARECLSRLEAH